MMTNAETFVVVATERNSWGKGTTFEEALTNARRHAIQRQGERLTTKRTYWVYATNAPAAAVVVTAFVGVDVHVDLSLTPGIGIEPIDVISMTFTTTL